MTESSGTSALVAMLGSAFVLGLLVGWWLAFPLGRYHQWEEEQRGEGKRPALTMLGFHHANDRPPAIETAPPYVSRPARIVGRWVSVFDVNGSYLEFATDADHFYSYASGSHALCAYLNEHRVSPEAVSAALLQRRTPDGPQ